DQGGYLAGTHVRPAEPRRGGGGRDLERGSRGHRAAALHLRRPGRSDGRRERVRRLQPQGALGAADSREVNTASRRQRRYFLEFSGLLDTGARRRHLLLRTKKRTKDPFVIFRGGLVPPSGTWPVCGYAVFPFPAHLGTRL